MSLCNFLLKVTTSLFTHESIDRSYLWGILSIMTFVLLLRLTHCSDIQGPSLFHFCLCSTSLEPPQITTTSLSVSVANSLLANLVTLYKPTPGINVPATSYLGPN